ncbi:MAG: hypothetical protein KGN84_05980 [Acidobacteriota bacterium]|nr:hypothetical protein [Acidobacteriota bacterium]
MAPSRHVRILLYVLAFLAAGLAVILAILIAQFRPIARSYVLAALKQRYKADVELGDLRISFFPNVKATGENLVLRPGAGLPPLVRVRRFTLDASLAGFFRKPRRIRHLTLEGTEIRIPPHSGAAKPTPPQFPFELDEVTANGTHLETLPADPSKDPLVFEIHELTLRSLGIGRAMTFRAALDNPKPPGPIHSEGNFGPWDADDPGSTPVAGNYTFRDADLGVFRGIGGTLSSAGKYQGRLNSIEVRGTTDTPNFTLRTAGRPVPLHTEFAATVDGSNGNTTLHPGRARLGKSNFEVSGTIDRGALEKHKTILLQAKATGARLDDFLRLAIKSGTPMTGGIAFDTKVKIPPGDSDVLSRMQLDGLFSLGGVKFTSPDIASKIAGLSHRAQGDPKQTDSVAADFKGHFRMEGAQLTLPDLEFSVPGAVVNLKGTYGVKSGELDFIGTAKMDATVSQMTTGIKRILLKPVDPMFKRGGAGTVLPIKISGTRGQPSFQLDIGKALKRQ